MKTYTATFMVHVSPGELTFAPNKDDAAPKPIRIEIEAESADGAAAVLAESLETLARITGAR